MSSDHEYEMALTTPVATYRLWWGVRLTRESAVGEKSLLWTESRCPINGRTLWPDCRESELRRWRRAAQRPEALYQA